MTRVQESFLSSVTSNVSSVRGVTIVELVLSLPDLRREDDLFGILKTTKQKTLIQHVRIEVENPSSLGRWRRRAHRL